MTYFTKDTDCFAPLIAGLAMTSKCRHCEERSDAAICQFFGTTCGDL